MEKLVARTVNNIQVKITNVHIRYEDNSKSGRPYSFGVTLNNFEIFTTDVNWQKCFVDGVIRHVFKLASLDSLSVYMNCGADSYGTKAENDIKELFRNNIASKVKTQTQYSFCKYKKLLLLNGTKENKSKAMFNMKRFVFFSIGTYIISGEITVEFGSQWR